MDTNTYYTRGQLRGIKAANVVKKAPAAILLYPAGFVVGFAKAFLPSPAPAACQQQPEPQQSLETVPA